MTIRPGVPSDAPGIAAVLEVIASERIHSAIDRAWSVDEERRYLESLSPREAIHIAVDTEDRIVGLQVLDRWSPVLGSMAHVGQIGTFILPAWRGRGVGRLLWAVTLPFRPRRGLPKARHTGPRVERCRAGVLPGPGL
jgi:GNAT superfamily N-acetyltransferase